MVLQVWGPERYAVLFEDINILQVANNLEEIRKPGHLTCLWTK
jgi:hypothetical protein